MTVFYGNSIYSGYGYPSQSIFYGEIEIEPDRWQMITIPVVYGYWDNINHQHIHDGQTRSTVKNYLLDQIEDIMGDVVQNYVKVVNTYIGDNNFFYNYIPGITNPLSAHNFPLAYFDGDRIEYVAFWLRSIHSENIVIKWGE